MQLRGADLRRVRLDALEKLNRHNISTNLVVTLKKGLNDHEIGRTIDFALSPVSAVSPSNPSKTPAASSPGSQTRTLRKQMVMPTTTKRLVIPTEVRSEATASGGTCFRIRAPASSSATSTPPPTASPSPKSAAKSSSKPPSSAPKTSSPSPAIPIPSPWPMP
jgi:hypothetical protein